MLTPLLIGFGGALGALLRYYTGLITTKFAGKSTIITGSAMANCIGCTFAGILLGYISVSGVEPDGYILFLTVGLLGSYTTFSTFALEAFRMFKWPIKKLIPYLVIQILIAFLLLAAGYHGTTLFMGGTI